MNKEWVYDQCFKIAIKYTNSQRDAERVACDAANQYAKGKLKRATDVFALAEKEAKRCGK